MRADDHTDGLSQLSYHGGNAQPLPTLQPLCRLNLPIGSADIRHFGVTVFVRSPYHRGPRGRGLAAPRIDAAISFRGVPLRPPAALDLQGVGPQILGHFRVLEPID